MNDLSPSRLAEAYRTGECRPRDVLEKVYERIAQHGSSPAWIHVRPFEAVLQELERAEAQITRGTERSPLFGVPFAVKDNIDVAGVPTTAGCPAFAKIPSQSAYVVEKLMRAGAVCVGKTNLDQFATGLVGTRSPYGACSSVFDARYISGGSSSGSAVVVARHDVGFALGTDTAGSGRVPAAFNGLVGLKPTRGLASTRGVVPACRSLDCVSVFAESVQDAGLVLRAMAGFDADDAFSRVAPSSAGRKCPERPRVAVPHAADLQFFGNSDYAAAFERSQARMGELGAEIVPVDLSVFRSAAALLYEGPWLAERWLVIRELWERNPDAIHPVVRGIIEAGRRYSAAETFAAQYRLAELTRQSQRLWHTVDALLLPTAPTHFTHDQVRAAPLETNRQLGTYTNFVNLLDLAGLALPMERLENGLPFGVTLLGPAFSDGLLAQLGQRLLVEPASTSAQFGSSTSSHAFETVQLAVLGAHLNGQPLHGELVRRGARFVARTVTAPEYRLFALQTEPPKPGLVSVATGGCPIEVEVYELDAASFGDFVAAVPAPMTIGNTRLEDGRLIKGFACESRALEGARDITEFGGWRRYLADRAERTP